MRPSYICYCLKSEVYITLGCQLCSTHYTAFQIKDCSKSISAISAYQKNKWSAHPTVINYRLKVKYPLLFVVGCVQPVTWQYESRTVMKSTSANKIATMKNTDDFHYKEKPSHATAKSTLFAVSKDEWDTKEDTSKSMKNALYVLQYAKRHLSGHSNVEH